MTLPARLALAACILASGGPSLGCLGTDEPEPIGYSPHLRAENAALPAVEADERLRKRIDNRDNIDGMQVPIRSAYAAGQDVRYYDFGTIETSAKPQWQFRRRGEGDAAEDFGHLDLVDSAPGDTGYTPLRALYRVFVTRIYDGERITSLDALEDALEIGLIEEPVALGSFSVCPILLADTALEPSDGVPAPLEPRRVYYRDHIAGCYGVTTAAGDGAFAFDERGMVPSASAYALRRQNETRALDEMLWQADFNADGDTRDSNLLFAAAADAEQLGVVWRMYEVTVAPGYVFGTSRAESDLFERQMLGLTAIDPNVIAYADSATSRLLVVWSDTP